MEDPHILCAVYGYIVLPTTSTPDLETYLIAPREHFLDVVLDFETLIDAGLFV